MDKAIKISVEKYNLVDAIAKKEQRTKKTIMENAVMNYARSKKMSNPRKEGR